MVNLDSITIVGLLFVAVFGVEAFTDNSLWSEPVSTLSFMLRFLLSSVIFWILYNKCAFTFY